MTPRKGNLMGVRTDIKVLDATIRDGGLCNNFDFSDEFVRELYKTNIKSGVDYMGVNRLRNIVRKWVLKVVFSSTTAMLKLAKYKTSFSRNVQV